MRPRLTTLAACTGMTLVGLVLAACAGELSTPTEALRLLTTALDDAIVGEPYTGQLQVTGGLRPYEFTLEDGRLPAGLRLENGSVRGTPSQLGEQSFTVRVSDANLSQFTSQFSLRVVSAPPTTLSLRPPETEVRTAVTLRARVSEARSLLGLRTVITWDEAAFQLREGSVTSSRRGVVLVHDSSTGRLQVDLVVLSGQGPGGSSEIIGGADVFSFVLEPLGGASQIAVASTTEFVSRSAEGSRREVSDSLEGGPAARLALSGAGAIAGQGFQGEQGEPPEPGDNPGEGPFDEPIELPEPPEDDL